MIELFVLALLALHGMACTAILTLLLWRSAWHRDQRERPAVPEKLEPPDLPYPALESHPVDQIFPIMAECFPARFERYRNGSLSAAERRELWHVCCAVHDARAEIEELCS